MRVVGPGCAVGPMAMAMSSCIKKIALTEPLVDTVNPDQICTKTCQLKSIDIHTVKKEDLNFSTDWSLVLHSEACSHCPPLNRLLHQPLALFAQGHILGHEVGHND